MARRRTQLLPRAAAAGAVVLGLSGIASSLRSTRTIRIGGPQSGSDREDDFGHAQSRNWTFLDRFAFHETKGRWTIKLTVNGISDPRTFDTWKHKLYMMGFWDEQWTKVYDGQHATDCKALVDGCDNYFRMLANHTHPRSTIQCNPVLGDVSRTALLAARNHTPGVGAYRVDTVHNAESCKYPKSEGSECEACDDGYDPARDTNRSMCHTGTCSQLADPFLIAGKSCVLGSTPSLFAERKKDDYVAPGSRTVQKAFSSEVWECDGDRKLKPMKRDRYWFFTLTCCSCEEALVDVDIHFTNDDENGYWREFSADESWLLSIYITLFVVCLIVLWSQCALDSKFNKSNVTRSLFKGAVFLQSVSAMCFLIRNCQMATSGRENEDANLAGSLIWAFSEVAFILLLFVLMKGLTIYRRTLRDAAFYKMGIFAVLYLIIYVVVIVYEQKTFDPAVVKFRYDTIYGTIICVLYIIGWAWFSYGYYFTVKPYKCDADSRADANAQNADPTRVICPLEKLPFFHVFYGVYTVWFLMMPATIWCVIAYGSAFDRANVVALVSATRTVFGYAVLVGLWFPSHKNKFFPFESSIASVGLAAPRAASPEGEASIQPPPQQRGPNPDYVGAVNNQTVGQIVARRSLFSSSGTSEQPKSQYHGSGLHNAGEMRKNINKTVDDERTKPQHQQLNPPSSLGAGTLPATNGPAVAESVPPSRTEASHRAKQSNSPVLKEDALSAPEKDSMAIGSGDDPALRRPTRDVPAPGNARPSMEPSTHLSNLPPLGGPSMGPRGGRSLPPIGTGTEHRAPAGLSLHNEPLPDYTSV